MLTTRCPDCQTTFRITSVVLHKAAGQVRCGQCQCVFSAFDSLIDTLTPPQTEALTSTRSDPIPAEQVDLVLDESPEPEVEPEPWYPEAPAITESPRWRAAAVLAAFALCLQGVHHYRAQLVELPYLGGALDRVYESMGSPIVNYGKPEDFTIIEWVATAEEAATDGPGRLDISAGIRNESTAPLPYPLLSLELTDRRAQVIGSRVFTPDEYMGTRMSRNARIRPNATVAAQLQLVDPGPDAYGFEVDICVSVDTQIMSCKSDAVFE